jgi:DnaJ homolog subfamily C member 9
LSDKASPETKDSAHTQFQEIAFAYAILSDTRRRSRYDATGNTSESLEDDDDFDWSDFFRSQKEEMVNVEAIQKIKEEYQHSDEERSDLLAVFEEAEGDMDAVYEEIMCSNVLDDDARFRKMIDEAIANKDVTAWKKYKKETTAQKRKRADHAKKEELEAREYAEELGVADKLFGNGEKNSKGKKGDTSDLAALIQQRQNGRENAFFDNLEAKYGGSKKSAKGKKRANPDEPPEEAFEKNRKKKTRA